MRTPGKHRGRGWRKKARNARNSRLRSYIADKPDRITQDDLDEVSQGTIGGSKLDHFLRFEKDFMSDLAQLRHYLGDALSEEELRALVRKCGALAAKTNKPAELSSLGQTILKVANFNLKAEKQELLRTLAQSAELQAAALPQIEAEKPEVIDGEYEEVQPEHSQADIDAYIYSIRNAEALAEEVRPPEG